MQNNYTAEEIERFWSKVDKSDDTDVCWNWKACKLRDGYGQFGIREKSYHSNRFAWEVTYGNIPEGLCVCHKCDNTSCCNPSHLFLGTKKDNSDDMIRKGRRASFQGERNGRCKVSDLQVLEIRKIYAEGKISSATIGKMFGLGRAHVWRIVNYINRS